MPRPNKFQQIAGGRLAGEGKIIHTESVLNPSAEKESALSSNAEQYYQKAIDGAFRSLDSHVKSMDAHIAQFRWVMGIGVAIISLLVGGLYFTVGTGFSSLRTEIQAIDSKLETRITEMDKRWEQRQTLYERYLEAKTGKP